MAAYDGASSSGARGVRNESIPKVGLSKDEESSMADDPNEPTDTILSKIIACEIPN